VTGEDTKQARQSLFDRVLELRSILTARAVHESQPGHGERYAELRGQLLAEPAAAKGLPDFVRTSYSLGDFWSFIGQKIGNYKGRRQFLREQFESLLLALDVNALQAAPADDGVTATLERVNWPNVRDAWRKALARRDPDPEGAITSARALVEAVCKHVLDDPSHAASHDLPKLYGAAAKKLKLSPEQHTEPAFKQILQGCVSVVNGLASLRNDLGDAHGKAAGHFKPGPRHADLAVNLAGALASFVVATWEFRSGDGKS
jgi:hypothetical protein